jgi:hypothetical protein
MESSIALGRLCSRRHGPASPAALRPMSLWPLAAAFWWVAGGALLAGLVRGFSGFGAAMVFMPIASALYEPRVAAVLLCIADGVIALPLLFRAVRHCVWREVLALLAGYAATAPLGVLLLVMLDPILVRWAISLMILLAVAGLAAGWRHAGRPGWPLTIGCGGLAGVAGGLAGISGPPIVLFWLGGQAASATVRANIFAFFGLTSGISAALYGWHGLFTAPVVQAALLLMLPYGLGIWLGTQVFHLASEQQFRQSALAFCALVAVATLPLWQSLASG